MKKAALHNLGCKVNAYETEAMEQMLIEDGYTIVPFSEEADVYVINTCSVTNIADKKSRQMIHRAKRKNPNAVVIGAGCYIQTATIAGVTPEELACDIIIGNNQKNRLIEELHKFIEDHRMESAIFDINDGVAEYENLTMFSPKEHTRAFVKIQDGCNQFCSYCIIPFARGRVRSRKIESIVEEVTNLAKNGYKEIVLTGIHLSSYGIPGEIELIDVIEMMDEIDGIERIRLGSLEPQVCTEEFCQRIAKVKKICPHFHLSLQSGSDATLKRMNRKYDAFEYKKGCERLRKVFDNPAITTDVIVGFPQESEEEFLESKAFLEDIHFYEMHVFKYSRRHGTKAASMDRQINESIKALRSDELISLGGKMSKEYRDSFLNKEVSVLVEEVLEFNGKTYWTGFTKEYIRVAFESEKDLANQIVSGIIKDYVTEEVMLLDSLQLS
ncbi:MAG: tRNA (N(6)-L-threonylcarbamoyladenosine(37)-C(2))-methylthiotransferase MtaB [Lachnospiraceae bacterium]|nr:tRNA (N(6)-L-threonylcarbamoyladenosine(37)-C(2))-methylthiotransferase MtaB [Lachnospiraceae bacterium]